MVAVVLSATLPVPREALSQPTVNGAFFCDGDDGLYNFYASAAVGDLFTFVSGTHAYAAMVVDPGINDNVIARKKSQDSDTLADGTLFDVAVYQDSAGWVCKDTPCDGDADVNHRLGELYGSDKTVWSVACGPTFTWTQDLLDDTDGDQIFWSFVAQGGEADFFSSHLGDDGGGTPPPGIESNSSPAFNMNQSTWDVSFGGMFDKADPNEYISPVGFPTNGYSMCATAYNWEWRIVYEIRFPLASCGSPISLWVSDAHNSPEKTEPDSSSVCTVDCELELPVELVSFTAIEHDGGIQLRWTTASETNNAGFSVEHAINNGFYKEIDFITGAGTSLERREYSYRVEDVEPGLHTFRLKQIDYDGAFEYSPAVEVTVEVPNVYILEPAYPNPFNPQASIRFAIKERQAVTMAMYDATGREVQALYRGIPDANQMHAVAIDGSTLPSGVYIVRLTGETFLATQSVTLVK